MRTASWALTEKEEKDAGPDGHAELSIPPGAYAKENRGKQLRFLRFSSSCPADSDGGVVGAVDQLIHHDSQQDAGNHIQHGVLL